MIDNEGQFYGVCYVCDQRIRDPLYTKRVPARGYREKVYYHDDCWLSVECPHLDDKRACPDFRCIVERATELDPLRTE